MFGPVLSSRGGRVPLRGQESGTNIGERSRQALAWHRGMEPREMLTIPAIRTHLSTRAF